MASLIFFGLVEWCSKKNYDILQIIEDTGSDKHDQIKKTKFVFLIYCAIAERN